MYNQHLDTDCKLSCYLITVTYYGMVVLIEYSWASFSCYQQNTWKPRFFKRKKLLMQLFRKVDQLPFLKGWSFWLKTCNVLLKKIILKQSAIQVSLSLERFKVSFPGSFQYFGQNYIYVKIWKKTFIGCILYLNFCYLGSIKKPFKVVETFSKPCHKCSLDSLVSRNW